MSSNLNVAKEMVNSMPMSTSHASEKRLQWKKNNNARFDNTSKMEEMIALLWDHMSLYLVARAFSLRAHSFG